jgi:serine/threonine protein phosphatase PrpC
VTNVGDSRAILKVQGRVLSLSQDHKPETLKEQERIQSLKGVIDYQYDSKGRAQGPLRVWTSQKEAGLAMTRSLGDQMVKQFGVCWQPGRIFVI